MKNRINAAEHKMNRESRKFQRGETEIQRKALAQVLKSSDKNSPDFQEKYDTAIRSQVMAKKLQEKIGPEYIVKPYQRRGYQKIAIDAPKETLKKQYGPQILKDTAENIKKDKKRYEWKSNEEIIDIYFDKVALPQVEITLTDKEDVFNLELRNYKEFWAQAYQGQLTGEQIEDEIENIRHYIPTGEMLTKNVKRDDIFTQADFNPAEYTAAA